MTNNQLINIINKYVGYAEPQIYEALNEYLKLVITKTLETAAEKAKVTFVDKTLSKTEISVESITNTFEETFNKYKI